MELNELKPCFERISFALMNANKKEHFDYVWDEIVKGIRPYEVKEFEKLKTLLEDFKLEVYINDFLFILIYPLEIETYLDQGAKNREYDEFVFKKEILNALSLLYNYKSKFIKIEIKHKLKNITTSINDEELQKIIKETLLKKLLEREGLTLKEGIFEKDLGETINKIISSHNEFCQPKKGRKKKYLHSTGFQIERLQYYLQNFTDIKANEETIISRKQASFIFKYLNIYKLIPGNLSWEEDNIRHIFKNHLESRKKIETLFAAITQNEDTQ